MPSQVFVGIDVAKAHLDIALRPTGTRWAVTNDDAGIASLVPQLQEIAPQLYSTRSDWELSAGRGGRAGGSGLTRRGGQSPPSA